MQSFPDIQPSPGHAASECGFKLTCFILTFNEEQHIARAIKSVRSVADRVVVVDSHSTDATVEIATALGAEVLQNAWPGYANQINWALEQISNGCDWLFRLDADEVLVPFSQEQIRDHIARLAPDVDGVTVRRRIRFLGQEIRHGGFGSIEILRLFRSGKGQCEQRMMDEHLRVAGRIERSELTIIDENLNSVGWMVEKHNRYASLEAVETLDRRYHFLGKSPGEEEASLARSARIKRALKHSLYLRLPGGIRAVAYFFFRYIFQLGFLDGRAGLIYHLLQALVYRTIVDGKVLEIERIIADDSEALEHALYDRLGFDLSAHRRNQGEDA